MKTYFTIFFLFFLTTGVFSQNSASQKDRTLKTPVTLYNLSGDNLFIPRDNSFRINRDLYFPKLNLLSINDSSTIWMRTRMVVANYSNVFEDRDVNVSDMLHPYLNFYIESKNVSIFRQVLGMAQLGAVGYLAYRHIKKYGLFHQP